MIDIRQNEHARKINQAAVETLAESMKNIGLQSPITVRKQKIFVNCIPKEGYGIICGQHRFEAARVLGWTDIDCFISDADETTCRMIEISENLHRAELTALERDQLVAEWVELVEVFSGQVAQKRGRPEGGISEASRQLNIERTEVRRAMQTASLTPEAKQTAIQNGLDNNRSALLEAAKLPPERQAPYLQERVSRTEAAPPEVASEKRIEKAVKAFNALSGEERQEFYRRTEAIE